MGLTPRTVLYTCVSILFLTPSPILLLTWDSLYAPSSIRVLVFYSSLPPQFCCSHGTHSMPHAFLYTCVSVLVLPSSNTVVHMELSTLTKLSLTTHAVIGWLNRQMNDNMMGGGGGGRPAVMATTSLGSIPRASSVHPSPPIVRRPSAPFGAVMGTIPFQQRVCEV